MTTFKTTATIESQYQFACKKYLGNATIVSNQTTIGVVTKPNSIGYTAIMLNYLSFANNSGIENDTVSVALDYCITN
jgi:hypothetical protein